MNSTNSHDPSDRPTKLDIPDPAQQFGAAAADDADLADRLTDAADGDLRRAEEQFDDEARGPASTEKGKPSTGG